MDVHPPRRPPPDDWGDEVEEEPDGDWPDAPGPDAGWPDPPDGDGPDPDDPWDPGQGPPLHDLPWPGEEEEPLPEEGFEHERGRRDLEPGRTILSYRETVVLAGLGAVPAECHTGAAESHLLAGWKPVGSAVRIRIGDRAVDLPLESPDGGRPAVVVAMEVAGVRLSARLRLDPADGPLRVVIGRDLLAGRFVVDVPDAGPPEDRAPGGGPPY